VAGLVATTAGCATNAEPQAPTAGGLNVVSGFYPLTFLAEAVGGDLVTVTTLTAPGTEPHDLELTPDQVAQVADAPVVLYLKGFQDAVDSAVETAGGDRALDVGASVKKLTATGDEGEGVDPHVWLDPTNMISMAEQVRDRLSAAKPDEAQRFRDNTASLVKELTALDESWQAGTTTCARRDLVVSHDAFGYLGARYNFRQVGLSGLSPDAEPSAGRLAQVSDFVRSSGATTIYYESLVDPKVAETVASETGAATAVLDPIEGIRDGEQQSYLTLMASNLETIRKGQSCT
jgi:zinc transport system substrate-binding protein